MRAEDGAVGATTLQSGGHGPLGTGVFHLSDGPSTDERRIRTRWLTVIFLPLCPLGGVGSSASAVASERGSSAVRSVFIRYGTGLAGALLAVGPLAWALRTVHETGPTEAVSLLLGVVWLLAVLARSDSSWRRARYEPHYFWGAIRTRK